MTKEQTVEQLNSMGYDAFLDGAIVMIRVDHWLTKKEKERYEDALTGIGHRGSYGYMLAKESENANRRNECIKL